MGAAIPTRARQVVRERDGGHCLRCGAHADEVHHRQRRREGGHGLSSLVSLCRVCHGWVHAHPEAARRDGFIVSVHGGDPAVAVVYSFMGQVLLEADGGMRWA